MAFIEVENENGAREKWELKKQSPITIGSHVSNDIVIDEADVAAMLCRISWGKGGFEVVSATGSPLDVNGVQKLRSDLRHSDVLHIGNVNVRFLEKEAPASPATNVTPSAPARPRAAPANSSTPPPAESEFEIEVVSDSSESDVVPAAASTPAAAAAAKKTGEPLLTERMRQAMRSQQRRPGEEDLFRSPLVLSLSIGAVVLLLASVIFYSIAFRQTTRQAFDVARQEYDGGNYRASIESLQKFISSYPRDPLTLEARRLLGLSKVRQLVEGGAPQFAEGLKELKTFIENQKDTDGFELLQTDLMKLGEVIALGAAEAAGKQLNPQLLDVSDQARTILKTYTPKDLAAPESLNIIDQAQQASRKLILRDDVFKEHLADIDQALTAKHALQAMQLRRDLLVRYPQFETDKQITERATKMLAEEQQQVKLETLNRSAQTADHAWPEQTLTLGFLTRTKTDEVSDGRTLVLLAHDCCYGIEMATGQPVWRRVIGQQTPFFPMMIDSPAGVLLFDTRHQELTLLQRTTGKLIWRQAIAEGVAGKPVLSGGLLYLSTRAGQVLSLAVDTGLLEESLTFSQPVSPPVELTDAQRLVVAGDREVFYTLTMRPFACSSVFNPGQSAGSIRAPLIAMASYLLAIENGDQTATLRLIDTGTGNQPLRSVSQLNVIGRVLDPPVLRGRDLFVPSTGVRVSSFTISDDPGQPPLTAGPVYVSEGGYSGSAYLLTGPDRQIWMATGALSKLRLSTEALQVDGEQIGAGIASQPLQLLSGSLFHARRRRGTGAVVFSRTDRDEMTSDWQSVLGSPIGAWSTSTDDGGSIGIVTDNGQTYRIRERQLKGHTFQMDPGSRLPLANELQSPLQIASISRGRTAVAAGGREPRYWIISPAGQIESSGTLPASPQAPPCELGNTTLFPLAGSIHVVQPTGQNAVQAFMLPSGEKQTWISVTAIGPETAAATTAESVIFLLKLNTASSAYLGEVSRAESGHPIHFAGMSQGGLFVVSDQSQRVSVYSGERLEPVGQRTMTSEISGPPRVVAGLVLVEEKQAQLHALEPEGELKTRWSIPLEQTSVSGVLEHKGLLVIATQRGKVLFVDPGTGELRRTVDLQNSLTIGPLVLGADLLVGTADGSILRIP